MQISTIKLASTALLASAGAVWLAGFHCIYCVPVIGSLLRLLA